jgi:hypothetical protein
MLSARTIGWTARTNVSFRVSKTFDMQGLAFYQAPMTVEQGRSSSRARFSMAARQKLMNDALSVTLRVIDPFKLSHERFTTIDPRFNQVSDRTRAERALLLSVNWTFGHPPKEHGKDQINLGSPDPGSL